MNTRPLMVRLASASRTAVVVGMIAAGCAAPGVSPSTASVPPPTAPPTASPRIVAADSGPVESFPQPPTAQLSVAGGTPSTGELGTYTWQSTGSDGPFLRGTPVKLRPGGAATISLQPAAAIATWSLREARPGDTTGSTSRDIASGSGPIAFTLPSDAGTLVLRVDFAANVGTANYFWAFSPG